MSAGGSRPITLIGLASASLHPCRDRQWPGHTSSLAEPFFILFCWLFWALQSLGIIATAACYNRIAHSCNRIRPISTGSTPFLLRLPACMAGGFVGTGNFLLLPTLAAMSAIHGVAALREEKQFSEESPGDDELAARNRTGGSFPGFCFLSSQTSRPLSGDLICSSS